MIYNAQPLHFKRGEKKKKKKKTKWAHIKPIHLNLNTYIFWKWLMRLFWINKSNQNIWNHIADLQLAIDNLEKMLPKKGKKTHTHTHKNNRIYFFCVDMWKKERSNKLFEFVNLWKKERKISIFYFKENNNNRHYNVNGDLTKFVDPNGHIIPTLPNLSIFHLDWVNFDMGILKNG